MPDLAVWKGFLRFQAFEMRGNIDERSIDESLNSFTEWFFAGFTRMTGTGVNETERREVYNVS